MDAVTAISFTADPSQFVSVGWDKNVKVWDLKAGHEIKNFPEADAINSCLLTPDGNKVVTAGAGDIHVWNKTTDRADTIVSYDEEIKTMIAVDNGRYFVTGDVTGTIAIWSFANFLKLNEVKKAHQLGVWGMDIFPEGRSIVTSGGNGAVTMWNIDYLLQHKANTDTVNIK